MYRATIDADGIKVEAEAPTQNVAVINAEAMWRLAADRQGRDDIFEPIGSFVEVEQINGE